MGGFPRPGGRGPAPAADIVQAISSLVTKMVSKFRGGGAAAESVWGLSIESVTMVGTILSFTFLGRSLGPDGYGGYAALYAIVGPLVTLAASGVTLSLLQHVVRDREGLESTARSCLTLSLVLGGLLTIVGYVAATFIVEGVATVAMIAILATEFVTMPLVHLTATTVQARSGFAASAPIRLVVLGARIVVLTVLFLTSTLSIMSLGLTMLVVSGVAGLVFLVRVGRRYDFPFVPGRVRWHHMKSNLAYSGGISADALGNEGDKLVLAANGLVVETGLYAAAYRIVQFGLLPVGSVIQATHARFLEHEEGLRRQHLDRALRYASLGAAYGVVFAIGISLVAPLLPIVLGDEFEESVTIVRWLSPIVLLRAVGSCSINGLMGLSKVTLRTILLAINAAMAMVLYIVLIPRYGWEGAAIGTLVGEVLSVVMTWTALVVCQRAADRELAVVDDDADSAQHAADASEEL